MKKPVWSECISISLDMVQAVDPVDLLKYSSSEL